MTHAMIPVSREDTIAQLVDRIKEAISSYPTPWYEGAEVGTLVIEKGDFIFKFNDRLIKVIDPEPAPELSEFMKAKGVQKTPFIKYYFWLRGAQLAELATELAKKEIVAQF